MVGDMKIDNRLGVVVAGAGARGAYEAGALSVLLPRVLRRGQAPVLVGTSAGALNVVGVAGMAEHGWGDATSNLVQLWSSVEVDQVADVSRSLACDIVTYSGQVAGLPTRLISLLDTSRLRDTLSNLLPIGPMHDNIRNGLVSAVAVATTSIETGGTVVFVEKHPTVSLPAYDAARNISYVETELTVDHVLASAAVPTAFLPVKLPEPEGWHIDGGVRLNAPLLPAIRLGCDHLAVVATHPVSWPSAYALRQPGDPDLFRVASLVLQSLLADKMVEDLRHLARVNEILEYFARQAGTGTMPAAGMDYQPIPFVFAGPPPSQAHEIGTLANKVFADGGISAIRPHDAWLLNKLIGGSTADHGELLSFVLFDHRFTSAAAVLGAEHARMTLPEGVAGEIGWQTTLDD